MKGGRDGKSAKTCGTRNYIVQLYPGQQLHYFSCFYDSVLGQKLRTDIHMIILYYIGSFLFNSFAIPTHFSYQSYGACALAQTAPLRSKRRNKTVSVVGGVAKDRAMIGQRSSTRSKGQLISRAPHETFSPLYFASIIS